MLSHMNNHYTFHVRGQNFSGEMFLKANQPLKDVPAFDVFVGS